MGNCLNDVFNSETTRLIKSAKILKTYFGNKYWNEKKARTLIGPYIELWTKNDIDLYESSFKMSTRIEVHMEHDKLCPSDKLEFYVKEIRVLIVSHVNNTILNEWYVF